MYNTVTSEIFYSSATTAQGKTFVVDHPTKPDNYLVHACLEGPETGVYYRGKAVIVGDLVKVNLPDYVSSFVYDFTVSVTPISKPRLFGASEVTDGCFEIYGPPGVYHWVVYGKRGDLITEPLKDSVEVKGNGPYRWI